MKGQDKFNVFTGASEALLKWGGAWQIVNLFTVNILQTFNLIPESLTFYMALENLWGGLPPPSSDAPGLM